ncbi:MAG: cupin [Planctomycetes bacterium RBG_16_64_10]|nr:MAG: cupin [Planctomycetes bacterium RBG_16_64_10]
MMAQQDWGNGPTDVTALVDYQDGAIVSRTLVKERAGTVTAFAFDAGQALSEHTTPFDALLQVVDGLAQVVVGGTGHRLQAGQMMRLPANVPHSVTAERRCKLLLVMIRAQ